MRLASTIILARPAGAESLEVLVVRRSSQSPFAPDAFVFPGGTVDAEDYERNLAWTSDRIAAEFRATRPAELPVTEPRVNERDAAALVNAALRELREEASIELDAAGVHLFSHWITPPTEPRRYNTHFFIGRASAAHVGAADRVETHDERWIVPSKALALHRSGEMHLVYPTIKHFERLAEFTNADALMEFAIAKPIVTIMPDCAPDEGFVMPASLERRW